MTDLLWECTHTSFDLYVIRTVALKLCSRTLQQSGYQLVKGHSLRTSYTNLLYSLIISTAVHIIL